MARKLVCDSCGFEEPDMADARSRWTYIRLAKLEQPDVPFQREEICPTCTTQVRQSLQRQPREL